jgi:hypothetical protein
MENLPQQLIELIYIENVNKCELDKQYEIVLKVKNKYVKTQMDKQINEILNNNYKVDSKSLYKHLFNWFYDKKIIYIVDKASVNGDLNVIKWCYERKFEKFEYSNRSVDNTSAYGNIDILDWFWDKRNEIEFKYSEYAITNASRNGQVKVLDWFYSKRNEIEFKYSSMAVDSACGNGHINVIDWFWERRNEIEFEYMVYGLDNAIANGYINVLEWFLEKSPDVYIDHSYDLTSLKPNVKNGLTNFK